MKDPGDKMTVLGPYTLGPNNSPLVGIYHGDAYQLAAQIPDETVDLILTDPVYDRIEDYVFAAQVAARVLKPNRACLMWQGQQNIAATMIALQNGPLVYRWLMGWYASNNMQMYGAIGRKWAPLLRYDKGKAKPRAHRDLWDAPLKTGKGAYNHKWAKRLEPLEHWIGAFTKPEGIVLDLFMGGGSLAAACVRTGRHYLGFEIDGPTVQLARARAREAERPLFVLDPTPLDFLKMVEV